MKKNSLLIAAFFLSFQTFLLAQKDTARLKQIEEKIEIISKYKEITDRDFQSKSISLDAKIDKAILDFDRQNSNVQILGLIGIIGGLASIIGGYFWVLGLIRTKVDEQITNLLETEKDKFKQLILSIDEEYQLRENKKIAVISNESIHFIDDFLNKSGFKQINHYSPNDTINADTDLIFLNNELGKLDDAFIKELADSKKLLFYFGGNKSFLYDAKNVNFANSRFQIYGNLINTLRYQNTIK
jgi:hypothetical protein